MKRRKTTRSRKKRKIQERLLILSAAVFIIVVIVLMIWEAGRAEKGESDGIFSEIFATKKVAEMDVIQMFLTPNEYSRPQDKLEKVNGIVIHYTANPGSTAEQNRNYFENLKDTKETSASSHFIIGLEGEVVQCIPLDEISYASNQRNCDTISIECCHEDESGKFNEKTYQSLVKLTAWLCGKYNLKKKDIIRHYDVTGKLCPKYFVEHEDKWIEFKDDVFQYIQENS